MTEKTARKKSDKRQRTKLTAHRWFEDEFNAAAAKANAAGLSFGAYIRTVATGDAGPRAQKRPPVDAQLVRQALAGLGKYGNNLNQLAHYGNAGNPVDLPELRRALKEWGEIRDLMLAALGHNPDAPTEARRA